MTPVSSSTPRATFTLGAALGIAAVAFVVCVFLLTQDSGRFADRLGWNFLERRQQYAPMVTAVPQGVVNEPVVNAGVITAPEVTDDDHILGDARAAVTLIEYADFQCPQCIAHQAVLKQLSQTFPKDVRIVYRHFPVTVIHPEALRAAQASECAALQGGNDSFWKMYEALFTQSATPEGLTETGYGALATRVSFDGAALQACIKNEVTKQKVLLSAASANDVGVQAIPANFVNGRLITGDNSYAALEAVVREAGAKE